MKTTFAAILALAVASATAAPTVEARGECTPATYQCTAAADKWQVCDVSGIWVDGGPCPPDTQCVFYAPTGSPFCVAPGYVFPATS